MITEIKQCRVCGNKDLVPILSLGSQRLSGVFPHPDSPQPSYSPLELLRCDTTQNSEACGLVQLKHIANIDEMYGTTYGYHSSLSPTMETHLQQKVLNLIDFVNPQPGEIILDIGCNDGTLLNCCEGKQLTRVGIDPSSEKFSSLFQEDIQVIYDFFSVNKVREIIGDHSCRIITSIAMFYDINDPVDFMRQIKALLASNGVWALELSYLPLMLTNLTYDQICHEHVTYLSLRDMVRMAKQVGLRIVDVDTNEVNGGSFYLILCHEDGPYQSEQAKINNLLQMENLLNRVEPYDRFRNRVLSHRDEVRHCLQLIKDSGKKIYGYGASTKGNIVLNFCDIGPDTLPFISDRNPEKHGLVTPGSSIPIISYEQMRVEAPDYLFVLIWHFRKEVIREEQAFLNKGGKLIFNLPRLHVVDARNYERYMESSFVDLAYSL
jgi:NDP-4-keto-2,6-dideoxyhexose 3-C-methyltransferase